MTWIQTIPPDDATGRLKLTYERVAGAGGQVDNILQAHSLRPHTLDGHMALYKAVLHHTGNTLPTWFLEAVGVYVSALNRCDYCVQHHLHGMRRRLDESMDADGVRDALLGDRPEQVFSGTYLSMLRYARNLTLHPAQSTYADVEALRANGASDAEILEVNQVAAYFAYANRMALGLGIEVAGEELGAAPPDSDSTQEWRHS